MHDRQSDIPEISIAFIIGTGRCGTTLAAKMLNAHTNICVPPELQIIFEYSDNGRRLNEIFQSKTHLQFLCEDFIREIERMCPHLQNFFDLRQFLTSYKYPILNLDIFLLDLYTAILRSQKKEVFLEQTPWYGQRLDLLKELFPQANFIHMIRDGRDVALSYARTPWWSKSPQENLERWAIEANKISTDAKKYIDPINYLEIHYEDLVLDTAKTVATMTEFLNEQFEPSQLDVEKHIDYANFRNFDATGISSTAYELWQQASKDVVFADNVFGWRKDSDDLFSSMSDTTQVALASFGYDT